MVEREALGAWFWNVEVGWNVLRGFVMVSVDGLTRCAQADRLQGVGATARFLLVVLILELVLVLYYYDRNPLGLVACF